MRVCGHACVSLRLCRPIRVGIPEELGVAETWTDKGSSHFSEKEQHAQKPQKERQWFVTAEVKGWEELFQQQSGEVVRPRPTSSQGQKARFSDLSVLEA